jgi:hypothetical protein
MTTYAVATAAPWNLCNSLGTDYSPIPNAAECCVTAAQALGTPAAGGVCPNTGVSSIDNDLSPRGCYIDHNGELYFNENDSSNSVYDYLPVICKKAGNNGGITGDPHMTAIGGGQFDIRLTNGIYFALWAACTLHINGMVEERIFKKMGGQIVEGTFFTRVAFKMAVDASTIVRAQVRAEQPGVFRMYGDDNGTGIYANRTSLKLSDASLSVTSNGAALVLLNHDVKVVAKWSRLRTPVTAAGQPVPKNHVSRYYLDTSFLVLNGTVPHVAPHGIIGQTFDASIMTVHGRRDNYGRSRRFKTSAQGEGAIEGSFKDYMVSSPFATTFEYSRFGVQAPVSPRNISALSGRKEPKMGGTAGSVEDDANE